MFPIKFKIMISLIPKPHANKTVPLTSLPPLLTLFQQSISSNK